MVHAEHTCDHTCNHGKKTDATLSKDNVTRDPVCGMTVDPNAGKPQHKHDGHEYHFCNPKCLEKFVDDPDNFLKIGRASCRERV